MKKTQSIEINNRSFETTPVFKNIQFKLDKIFKKKTKGETEFRRAG